ncbi:unnamed protein product [Cuscuta epithymum]|uniref:Uncharacterized protein n=1 Tax=Cuscuta epithymum TaxID=186058 RepID=A0AAV0GJ58_9ASTE|nr:unnamed protein product [Cuscuta epithymum]CAH9147618.1 unnamed protein product [Cuscuta epithymum]
MMSAERSFEAWEEVQRQGQDFADRLAQGFTGLIHSHIAPPSFSWPTPQTPKLFDVEFPAQSFVPKDFGIAVDKASIQGVSAILDIGNKIGQAGADFGACLDGMVQQFARWFPVPFKHEEISRVSLQADTNRQRIDMCVNPQEDLGLVTQRLRDFGRMENGDAQDGSTEEDNFGANLKKLKHFGKSQGTFNFTSTYNNITQKFESSLTAKGDLWRVEASQGRSTSGNESSSLFLLQLGPVLFVRDSTLLLPVHLSKQHLLWYGYDRKHGMHSLCPAVWSKQRKWLCMSMICLSPLSCSFMDLQFPNGQFTYISGEGISTSAFVPLCGGLLQVQGQCPGDIKLSYSCKNKWGTCIAPTLQWPDKSFTLGFSQPLAWKRSGLMYRPNIQLSLCPTYGGSNPGVQAELTHSLGNELNLICGCALARHSSAFASLSLGRSKWNGNVGSLGAVLKIETPIGRAGNPSLSLQFNSGFEL